jgi:hypothetical protein
MFHKLVWNKALILITQNTTNYYIYYTNYYKLLLLLSTSSSSISSSDESDESSSPPSLSESHRLFLNVEDSASTSNLRFSLSLDAILWRRESLEREGVIGLMRERESERRSGIYSHHRWHIRRDVSVMGRSASNSQ